MRTGDSLRLKNSLMIGGQYKIDDIAPVLGVNPIALKQTGVFRSIGSDAFVILVTLQKNPDTTQYMDILNKEDAILFWEGQTKRRIAEKAFGEGADCHVFIRDIPGIPYTYYGRASIIRWHENDPGKPSQFVLYLPDYADTRNDGSSGYEGSDIIEVAPIFGSTETARFQTVRTKQQEYRNQVLSLWHGRCAVTGVDEVSWLIASHIKPWRESTESERIDPKNSLLLSPNYDKLFDRGVISFSPDNGRIILPENASYQFWKNLDRLGIDDEKTLVCIPSGTDKYLDYHRKRVFGYKPSSDFDMNEFVAEMLPLV